MEENTTEQQVKPYQLFFVLPEHKRSYKLLSGRIINLELGIPSDAVDLFKSGKFDYFRLKKGAEILFENLSEEEILNLISRSKYQSDVKVLSKLVESNEGKRTVALKLKSFKI